MTKRQIIAVAIAMAASSYGCYFGVTYAASLKWFERMNCICPAQGPAVSCHVEHSPSWDGGIHVSAHCGEGDPRFIVGAPGQSR